jgi:uncharacterized membrane protein
VSDPGLDGIVEDYLGRLRRSLEGLPGPIDSQILSEICAHVDEGRAELRPETEVSLRTMLDRVGDPEEIAAEAGASADTEKPEERAPSSSSGSPEEGEHRRSWRRPLIRLAALATVCGLGIAVGVVAFVEARPPLLKEVRLWLLNEARLALLEEDFPR